MVLTNQSKLIAILSNSDLVESLNRMLHCSSEEEVQGERTVGMGEKSRTKNQVIDCPASPPPTHSVPHQTIIKYYSRVQKHCYHGHMVLTQPDL